MKAEQKDDSESTDEESKKELNTPSEKEIAKSEDSENKVDKPVQDDSKSDDNN